MTCNCLLDVVIVKSPVIENLTLQYYRKLLSTNWKVLVSRKSDDIITFLKQEDLNYQEIDEDLFNFDNGVESCNLIYLTEDRHDENIDKLFDITKCSDMVVDINFLGANEQLSLLSLKMVMERLRGPGGCSFDRKQTHDTLKPYLVEETYEVLEGIDHNSPEKLCEELGDLLLQIVFHTQIAEERGEFQLPEVLDTIKNKLIRRHPHVFGGEFAYSDYNLTWEEIKYQEKSSDHENSVQATHVEYNSNGCEQESILDGILESAPAMVRAEQIQKRCRKIGFDWEDMSGAITKVEEELAELLHAYQNNHWEKLEEELGDLIFSLINLSRFLNISTEATLEKTNRKFINRFKYIEEKVTRKGHKIVNYSLEDLDKYWEEAKKRGI